MKRGGWIAIAIGIAVAVAVVSSQRGGSEPASPSAQAIGELPAGPTVLVANGYQAPQDRVDSTGAFVPANGQPTLVWVDAIW